MNKICTTNDWILRAEIAHIQRPPDSFHLQLTTQLLTAKDPQGKRTAYQQTFSRDQLTKLRDIINLALLETP